MTETCPICHSKEWTSLYVGPIRTGRFGQWSDAPMTVWRCLGCGAGHLPAAHFDYETDEYRDAVDGCADIEGYRTLHDPDQAEKLAIVGPERIRGRVVADVGCGGGAFLDVAYGLAGKTVAVEPCQSYHPVLRERHAVFSWCGDALRDHAGQVDVAVSFAVLEHVANPRAFLEDIHALLKPGGRVLLSTPNADDWLLSMLPDTYARFFYRKAHRWYFNADSLCALADQVGFGEVRFLYRQRFDLSNALLWIRDGKPSGLGKIEHLRALDGAYKGHLEASGKADFLYAWMTKP